MPDGSAYEEWQFLHQNNENTEVHKEEEILEKLPDNLISTSDAGLTLIAELDRKRELT